MQLNAAGMTEGMRVQLRQAHRFYLTYYRDGRDAPLVDALLTMAQKPKPADQIIE
jgi:hypothetical protein